MNIGNKYPLSPMQEGMLYQNLRAPRSGVDVQQQVDSLREELDVASFQQACQTLVARHEILRTSFLWAGLREPTLP